MADRRPRHASSEIDMPDRRPTCLMGDQHVCGLRSIIGILTQNIY